MTRQLQVLLMASALAACGEVKDSHPPTETPDAMPADPPQISGAVIQGQTTLQVRQGASIVLEVTGANLPASAEAKLGDTAATKATDVNGNGTVLRLELAIPHGAALGDAALVITTSGGSARLAQVVTITAITVTPAGDDARNRGTTESPFATVSKALSVAGNGDTVTLAAGQYDVLKGETWPEHPADHGYSRPNVPAGVILEGQGPTTILTGGGIANPRDGLVFKGDATVRKVAMTDFVRALVAGETLPQTVTLEDVTVTRTERDALFVSNDAHVIARRLSISSGSSAKSGTSGVFVLGAAQLELVDSEVQNAKDHGVEISGTGTVSLQRVDIHDNGDGTLGASGLVDSGVVLGGAATITVEASKLRRNHFSGLYAHSAKRVTLINVDGIDNGLTVRGSQESYGAWIQGDAVSITGGNYTNNGRDGVLFQGPGSGEITGANISGNFVAGFSLGGARDVKVRNTKFLDNPFAGVFLAMSGPASQVLDFSTPLGAGVNTFRNIGSSRAIEDGREPRPSADGPVANFSGCKIDAAVMTSKVVTGPATEPKLYNVPGANNRISF